MQISYQLFNITHIVDELTWKTSKTKEAQSKRLSEATFFGLGCIVLDIVLVSDCSVLKVRHLAFIVETAKLLSGLQNSSAPLLIDMRSAGSKL